MSLLFALLLIPLCLSQPYNLQTSFPGSNFFDGFDFWTSADPTIGYVHYVDQATAQQHGMIDITANSTRWGVDTTQVLDPYANLGRLSIRLTSRQSWTHGLFILDLEHMPANQCGTWPAFWSLGSGTWPYGGKSTFHPGLAKLTHPRRDRHHRAANGFTGCGVSATKPNNIGYEFSANRGGVYAMEWTSAAIKIWFFPRNAVPAGIAAGTPDPTTFGVPMANFQGSCDIDAHFMNHKLVFDIDFCGSYAGGTWQEQSCPALDPANGWQSCNDYVAGNPQAFTEAYWQVNYLNVYQMAAGSSTMSSVSSVTPAIRTSSVSTALSAAQGRSTTPSGTPSTVTASLVGGTLSWPSTSSVSKASGASIPATTAVVVVYQTVTVVGSLPLQRAKTSQPMTGGGINFCGVAGSACFRALDESTPVETSLPIQIGNIVPRQVEEVVVEMSTV
ncbi:hypothetical protein LTR78_001838 [Recurvomyces mirabilis]|uniref:GH16 domain-containing protein n=1 Tax=Recurvomyces mirabilis TaxID=574656 RepID=A0AAE0WUR4_9PEZI|nr:hypothetical protein LTR78_001838 [Recurvomyces mirabilis]KAK5156722.1 hypothetical protein LTS14_004934 [Recurvomyces mirabilis]